jgi:uncharacterized repeat protein (TIGR03806 family)
MKRPLTLAILILIVILFSCKKDDKEETIEPTPTPDTSVQFDLGQVPYPNLSDYQFFTGTLADLQPNSRVLPYDVITPLFSDYAHKKRFVWMPQGVSASYVSDGTLLNFPDGTVFIKNFYYDHVLPNHTTRILETRLMYKKDGNWKFADYTWNDAQTEATFSLDGSHVPVDWEDESGNTHNVNFRIPSEVECFTCHKTYDVATPIGPKPQNLNSTFTYSDGSMNQLARWVQEGYLEPGYPENIVTVPDWTDESQPLLERVRAYVDMNCAHCHKEGSHCSYRPLRFAYTETTTETNLGVCVLPQEVINSSLTHIISRGKPNRSVMFFRLNNTEEQFRMPLLGRTVIHEEAVQLFEAYINSLTPDCE